MGWSDKPGVCKTDGCPSKDKPLEECDCTDGEHYGRLTESDEVGDLEEEE